MGKHLGDYAAGSVIDWKFNTIRPSTGAPFTLAGTPTIAVYKDNGMTESTAGATLTVDFDTRTGLHNVRVDTSADGTFYSVGSSFSVVLTAGTVDGVSAAGLVVGSFTVGRTHVSTMAANSITSAVMADASIDAATFAADTGFSTLDTGTAQAGTASTITLKSGSSSSNGMYVGSIIVLTGGTGAGQVSQIASYVGSTKVATVAPAWTAGVSPTSSTTYAILPFSQISASAPTAAENADAIWDELAAGHVTAGSFGALLTTAANAVDTEIAAIKAVTDQFVAAQSDVSAIPAATATLIAKINQIHTAGFAGIIVDANTNERRLTNFAGTVIAEQTISNASNVTTIGAARAVT